MNSAWNHVQNTIQNGVQNNHSEIAIIGAGPTGLMLANLLGLYGVKTAIFERREQPFTEPRAIAFDPETLRLFETVGCYEALSETLQLDVPVHYLNASGKTLAQIWDCPPAFGHSGRGTYYQPELESALFHGLQGRNGVDLSRGLEVSDIQAKNECVELSLKAADGEIRTVTADYVVDCSGGASHIRRALGIDFVGNTFREKWLVIDVEGDDYSGCEIKFFCDPKRPAVTLPVSKNRRRWEFLVMPGDNEAELVSEASARALMATYGAGHAKHIERSLIYTFHARLADRFRRGRVLLAGDAAHVMPPFAGQGLNSGMRDAANLAWKLAGVIQGKFADSILDSYESERRQHVKDMTKLTIKLGRSIMPTSEIRAWLRDLTMMTAWRFRRTREKLNRGDMIPKPSIKGSKLANWGRSAKVGTMIEQPTLVQNGTSVRLDEVLGPGFSAIAVNCEIENSLHASDQRLLQTIDAKTLSIVTSPDADTAKDSPQQALANALGSEQAILVVRPDRFVVDVFAPNPTIPKLEWMTDAYCVQTPGAS
ncbi:MAG: bifunctional 3-(3-hydroxy-phenyl)propionate/3-hydroxycinnamic acid hydroxylase [Pseudomonadota bacterium]